MAPKERHLERLIALVIAGAFAFNYPLMYLFSSHGLLFGIPVLYLYLFLTWGLFIALAAATMEFPFGRKGRKRSPIAEEFPPDA